MYEDREEYEEYNEAMGRLKGLLENFQLSPDAELATENMSLEEQFSYNTLATNVLQGYEDGPDELKQYTQKSLYNLFLQLEGGRVHSMDVHTKYIMAVSEYLRTLCQILAYVGEPPSIERDTKITDYISKQLLLVSPSVDDATLAIVPLTEAYLEEENNSKATMLILAQTILTEYMQRVLPNLKDYAKERLFLVEVLSKLGVKGF